MRIAFRKAILPLEGVNLPHDRQHIEQLGETLEKVSQSRDFPTAALLHRGEERKYRGVIATQEIQGMEQKRGLYTRDPAET